MAHLGITATVDQVRLAEHRITHAARLLRSQGDHRTMAQLKSDLALDLLTGRGAEVPTPAYARPVINLTVPIQTVMGIADEPGVLSGGTPVPAGLARAIAADPDATWYRMLTDPAGQMVELVNDVVPTDRPDLASCDRPVVACFEPSCHAPATQAELDHRIRWPEGETRTGNLWPGCKRGHTAKHTPRLQHRAGSGRLLRTTHARRVRPPSHAAGATGQRCLARPARADSVLRD